MKRSLCKHYPDFAAAFLRLGLAAVFIPHGWQKIQDVGQFVQFVGTLGLPAFLAYVVVVLEFVGGIFLLVGVLTEYVSWLLAIEMLVVVLYVKGDAAFIGGTEFEFALMVTAVALALLGPGKYALEKHFNGAASTPDTSGEKEEE